MKTHEKGMIMKKSHSSTGKYKVVLIQLGSDYKCTYRLYNRLDAEGQIDS